MFNKLFGKKKEFTPLDERVVWGIWTPRKLQLTYKVFAADLRVPISVLVCHILHEWVTQNYETLLSDKQKKLEFADYLAKKYLSKQIRDEEHDR